MHKNSFAQLITYSATSNIYEVKVRQTEYALNSNVNECEWQTQFCRKMSDHAKSTHTIQSHSKQSISKNGVTSALLLSLHYF